MKHCFAFFIKLVVGSILLIPSVDSAVCDRFLAENQAIPFARAHWLNSFKWAGDFVLNQITKKDKEFLQKQQSLLGQYREIGQMPVSEKILAISQYSDLENNKSR